MTQPVSVILPVYNTREFLAECIESVLKQTHSQFELIIVDDGSTDDGWSVIEQYRESDPRIIAMQNERNLGLNETVNKAIKMARHPLISRLDSDDYMYPKRLELQVNYMEKNPGCVILGAQCDLIEREGKFIRNMTYPLTHQAVMDQIFIFNPFSGSSIMVNFNLLPKDFLWFDPHITLAEDLDFYFRASVHGTLENLPETLGVIRERWDSLMHLDIHKTYKQISYVRKRAMKLYSFKPTLKQRLAMFGQWFLVTLVPIPILMQAHALFKKLTVKPAG